MNEEGKKSFLSKLIISIKKFEKYPELASKNWGVVLSYLVKLLAIFTIVIAFVSTYNLEKEIENSINYIKTNTPNFVFENNKLKVEEGKNIVNTDMDNLLDTIIVDTNKLTDDQLQNYKSKLENSHDGILFLEDKVFFKTQLTNGIVEYDYSIITDSYQITKFDKNQLIEYFSGNNLIFICVGIFIIMYIYLFLIYFTSIWLDVILLAILGYFTSLVMRLRIRFSAMCKIAIHSLTLPVILNIITILIENFTSFRVKYFEVMYMGVAYIYVITAIFMIKSDIIKNQKELNKIIEEQQKIRKEIEIKEKDIKPEENQKDDDKQNDNKEEKQDNKKEKDDKKDVEDNELQGENA